MKSKSIRPRQMFTLLTLLGQFWAPLARANEVARPTRGDQLPIGTTKDIAYRVKTARVVAFNRYALERDFPYLRGKTDRQIEEWILSHAAYVNANQLRLDGIRNSPIDVDRNDQKTFYIQPGVGRGGDVEVQGGMVSLKGTGNSSWNEDQVAEMIRNAAAGQVEAVRKKDHASGLEIFGLGVAEYLRHIEIQEDFTQRSRRAERSKESVESYYVVDNGFDVLFPGGKKYRAFTLGRQANVGRTVSRDHLAKEFYTDKGMYQETATGSRIDFGGSRTPSEKDVAYHDQMDELGFEAAASFIAEQVRRINPTAGVAHVPIDVIATLRSVLARRWQTLSVEFHPHAIGKSFFEARDERFELDAPELATAKVALFQLPKAEVERTLRQLDEAALENLFRSARDRFKIPLPEVAYHFGMARGGDVANAAADAAVSVFERFPQLVKPTLQIARRGLDTDSWAPNVVGRLVESQFEFPGFEAFLLDVVRSRVASAKTQVYFRLWKTRKHRRLKLEIAKWVHEHETNVHSREIFEFYHSQNVTCERRLIE